MPRTTHRRFTLAVIAISGFGVLPAGGQVIREDLKLSASDGVADARFGYSIAIDGGVVAVGALSDNDNGVDSGSAYIFDASTGGQLFKLLPIDGAASDLFGISVDIDNGVVVVGAYQDDDNGIDSGSVYLFDASTGEQIMKLVPSDGSANDLFGASVAIDNGVVVVGAQKAGAGGDQSGSAYIFDVSTGEQLFKLMPNDGAADDWFGWSIGIDNGVVAVGAVRDDDNGDDSGSVYLFDALTGMQLFKLLPNDGAAGDLIGSSIAMDNGVVAVGARSGGDNGFFSGSAYLFDVASGEQIFKLSPSDGTDDQFGISIGIDSGIVAVGAFLDDDNGGNSGSAYIFDASTGAQIFKILPSDGAEGDNFGTTIGIDNGVVVVGSLFDDDNGSNSGAAYVFPVSTDCAADLTGEGDLNFFDVSAFLVAFGGQDPVADFEPDGLFNFFDVSAFLLAFGAGCP